MASALRRRAFVIGGHVTQFIGKGHPKFIAKGHADFGKVSNPAIEWYISEVRACFVCKRRRRRRRRRFV